MRLSNGLLLTAALAASSVNAEPPITYTNTRLTACPMPRGLDYFWTWSDEPSFRSKSWCGAFQALIDNTNAQRTGEDFQYPYALESCTEPIGYTYSYGNKDGTRTSKYVDHIGPNMVCSDRAHIEILATKRRPKTCPVGNPIHPETGSKWQSIIIGSAFKTPLTLDYNSVYHAPISNHKSNHRPFHVKGVGPEWSTNLHRGILRQKSSAEPVDMAVLVARGAGLLSTFKVEKTNDYTPVGSTTESLINLPVGQLYVNVTEGVEELYDSDGRIARLQYIGGYRTDFAHDEHGRLAAATDIYGRKYQLFYGNDSAFSITSIIDPANKVTAFTVMNNLPTDITWPDGKSQTLHYENGLFPWALTGITDELGQRHSTFSYDDKGRAVGTRLAGGANAYGVGYGNPPQINVEEYYDNKNDVLVRTHKWNPAPTLGVSTPRGGFGMTFASVNGENRLVARTQGPGAGCADSTSAMAYDTDGHVESRDDFNGNRICYTHDSSRGFELTRVEGLAAGSACNVVLSGGSTLPAGSRKISSEWHPDWQLPVRTAAPGKLTTRIYNGQRDPFAGNAVAQCAPNDGTLPSGKPIAVLCKQVEQATADQDGSQGFAAPLQSHPSRTWQWTYNAAGQPVSARDPRGHITTYSYYDSTSADASPGDLRSITDPSGAVTNFNRYDRNGNLLQWTDANGTLTSYTYDLRERPLTTTTAGQTTQYQYDAAGQLLKVTLPDGDWFGFEYDAAHRKIAAKDSSGNRIDYVLNGAGDIVKQETRDPAGALRGYLDQSFDALGKVCKTPRHSDWRRA